MSDEIADLTNLADFWEASAIEYSKRITELEADIAEQDERISIYLSQSTDRKVLYIADCKKRIAELEGEISDLKYQLGGFQGDYLTAGKIIKRLRDSITELEAGVLRIVDNCFHAYASSYRNEAREMATEQLLTLTQPKETKGGGE